MKKFKNYIILLTFFLFTASFLNAGTFTSVQEPMGADLGVWDSSIAFGDYDNDGDLDIALTGYDGINLRFIIFQNDAGVFNQAQEPMGVNMGVNWSTIAFGDIDNDGDLDIALTGQDNAANYRFIIYRNDAGVFNQAQEPMGANMGVWMSSIAYGDIDNDGDLDIALTGNDGAGPRFIIYRNDGGVFNQVQEPMGANLGVEESSIAYGDYDNDGDLDIALTGRDGGLNYRFIIYRNDAGVFNQAQEPMGVNMGVNWSTIAFGDIDNDGDLDIALTGQDNAANYRFIIYRNDAGVFNQAQEPMGANLGVIVSSIAYGDYDNDGDLDIALTGEDVANPRFIIYRNDAGVFNQAQEPMGANLGVAWSSIAFGDIDNDGDLDIALTGWDGVNSRFIIYQNNEATTNNPPAVPTGMSSTNVGGYWRLSWDQSSDDHTAADVLRYQIAIGTNSGIYDYASTNIDYPRGQANIGKVTVVTGTPWYQTSIPTGKSVYWKVLAIDSAFKHSAYSSEQVAIPVPPSTPTGLTAIAISSNQIDLSWNDVSNETSYTLFRNTVNITNSATNIAGFSANNTNYNDTGLNQGTLYFYWVKAYNTSGESAFSSVASATTPIPNVAPIISGMSAAQNAGSGIVTISYTGTDANDNDCYYVTNLCEYSTNGTTWNVMTRLDAGDETFTSGGNDNFNFLWDTGTDLGAIEDSTVWVRLVVNDGTTNSAPVAVSNLIVDTIAPTGVYSAGPNDKSTNRTESITLNVTAATDGTSLTYMFLIADNESFDNPETSLWQTELSWTADVEKGKTYYWKVVAKDSGGNTTESAEYILYNMHLKTVFSKHQLRVIPNHLGCDTEMKIFILLGGVPTPADKYFVKVINILGNRVVENIGEKTYEELNNHSVIWEVPDSLASGVYIVYVTGTGGGKKYRKNLFINKCK